MVIWEVYFKGKSKWPNLDIGSLEEIVSDVFIERWMFAVFHTDVVCGYRKQKALPS